MQTGERAAAGGKRRAPARVELELGEDLERAAQTLGLAALDVGDETIGAVGVSGSTSGGDEACAIAGVAKVADQLKP